MGLLAALARLSIVIFGSYAAAVGLIHLLPSARIVALGIYAGNEGALPELDGNRNASLLELFSRVATLDLGLSIDRVPVTELIVGAVRTSLPQLTVAFAILIAGYLITVLVGRASGRPSVVPRFVSTLPLYVPVMVVASALAIVQVAFAHWFVSGVALAIVPLAYLITLAERARNDELRAPYTLFHVAQGATQWQIRLRVLRGATLHLLPSLQVLAIALMSSQVFVETMANIGGLGSLTVRAAKRVDLNLLLGLVLFYASVVGFIDAAARILRSRYPL